MARKTTKRPSAAARRTQFQPQDLLFAGLGAVSLGRKQAVHMYANGFEGVSELRERAGHAVQVASKKVNGKVAMLRKQAQAKAAPVRKQVVALAKEARAQAEARLAPVLARLGAGKAPAKRSTARKKAPAKRSRKAA